MKLYRRKSASCAWSLAPKHCMTVKQEAGYEYRYFANDAAAKRGTTFN